MTSSDRNNVVRDAAIMNKAINGGTGRSIVYKAGICISRISVYYSEDKILSPPPCKDSSVITLPTGGWSVP